MFNGRVRETSGNARLIIFILGTRPEVIKLAPVIKACQNRNIECYIVNTGQQQSVVEPFLQEFGIQADINIMFQTKRSLGRDFSFLVGQLDSILDTKSSNRPIVAVQGDTLSATAGAIAAFNLSIPVVHIEAGLRSGDQRLPFPEEGYRRMITQIANYHFAPSETARINLLNSGVPKEYITVSGNTGIDSFLYFLDKEIKLEKNEKFSILVTLHRRENFGENINKITHMLGEVAREFSDVEINFIKHTNPEVIKSYNRDFVNNPNVIIHQPLNYKDMVKLLASASLIITDSGGVQEESSYLGTPIIVSRSNTERKEILNSNCLSITTDPIEIRRLIIQLMFDGNQDVLKPTELYGKGNSSEIVVDKLLDLNYIGPDRHH